MVERQRLKPRLLLRGDRVIDGTGAPPREGAAVGIEGGRMVGIGLLEDFGSPADWQVHELPGCTLLPGLVDSHVHLTFSASTAPFKELEQDSGARLALRAARNARQALLAGVTTVRDLGSRGRTALEVRDAVAAGIIPGPRILAAGRPITINGGHCHFLGGVAEGVEQVRGLTRELLGEGVDAIKIMATGGNMTVTSDPLKPAFSREEVEAIVGEAHAARRRVTAHARGVAGIAQMVDAGVDSIEHCRMEVGPGVWGFDEDLARRMAGAGITAAPTLAASYRAMQYRERGGEVAVRAGAIDIPTRQKNAARLRECGVTVVVGTDAGAALATFDEAAHVEMELLVKAGWTPLQAINAGTLAAARAIGLGEEIGSLEPGKRADVVAVLGDPSRTISHIRRVRVVVQGGVMVAADGQALQDARAGGRGL